MDFSFKYIVLKEVLLTWGLKKINNHIFDSTQTTPKL